MPTPPLPVIERALEANFGHLDDPMLPPDEIQIEWERRHTRHGRLLSDVLRRSRSHVAWVPDDPAPVHVVIHAFDRLVVGDAISVWGLDVPKESHPEPVPVAREDVVLGQFQELARKWHQETDHLSSPTDIAMNFNYQQIIGKGERFLPFIFDELRAHGGNWYWALRAITGTDPVPPGDRGNVAKMKQAWLKWWEQHG